MGTDGGYIEVGTRGREGERGGRIGYYASCLCIKLKTYF